MNDEVSERGTRMDFKHISSAYAPSPTASQLKANVDRVHVLDKQGTEVYVLPVDPANCDIVKRWRIEFKEQDVLDSLRVPSGVEGTLNSDEVFISQAGRKGELPSLFNIGGGKMDTCPRRVITGPLESQRSNPRTKWTPANAYIYVNDKYLCELKLPFAFPLSAVVIPVNINAALVAVAYKGLGYLSLHTLRQNIATWEHDDAHMQVVDLPGKEHGTKVTALCALGKQVVVLAHQRERSPGDNDVAGEMPTLPVGIGRKQKHVAVVHVYEAALQKNTDDGSGALLKNTDDGSGEDITKGFRIEDDFPAANHSAMRKLDAILEHVVCMDERLEQLERRLERVEVCMISSVNGSDKGIRNTLETIKEEVEIVKGVRRMLM